MKKHRKPRLVRLTGLKFGKLTVVKHSHQNKRGYWMWICKCDCGGTKIVQGTSLRAGMTRSCGCLQHPLKNNHPGWKGYGDISGDYYSTLKACAKVRDICFNVSLDYLWRLFLRQKRQCKLSGELLEFKNKNSDATASLDRINSYKGYVRGNVQWIHKDINKMKMDFPQNSFLKWCERITKYGRNS
jgi:hypothetical protein